MSSRRTRSQAKAASTHATVVTLPDIEVVTLERSNIDAPADAHRAHHLPAVLNRSLTGLTAKDHKVLLQNQARLRQHSLEIPAQVARQAAVLDATLVFAQEEAGTAVCIAPNGVLLTCSHCVAEDANELNGSKVRWLLFSSGIAVKATCLSWDEKRDLALLQVVAAQHEGGESSERLRFPHLAISPTAPALNSRLVCIGHPGSEDLEASQSGVKTNYDVLHVSTGRFRGYAKDQDLQDNSEIGALMHDCWTYWGHSGAPLLDAKTGGLIGLHSSWDDETGTRRGVPLEAIVEFLKENAKHIAFTIGSPI